MWVHLHGGLVCFWYLLVFGVTSLGFNHPGWIPRSVGAPVEWEKTLVIPATPDDLKLGEAVQQQLDLIGWVLPWNLERMPSGDLRFEIERPGRKYRVTTDRAAARVRVEESRTGPASILHFLHGSAGGVPGTRVLDLWGAYTDVTTGLVLFLAVSGVVLWLKRSRDRRLAALLLLTSLGASACLMTWICLRG